MPADPILILLQRLSETQVEQGRKLDESTRELHETRRTLDVLNARLEPLVGLPARFSQLETLVARHDDRIQDQAAVNDAQSARLAMLEAASHRRSGWETPGGKLLYLVGGALVTAIIATGIALLVSKPAQASDVRLDPVAKCMAVPAKPRPKYLFV